MKNEEEVLQSENPVEDFHDALMDFFWHHEDEVQSLEKMAKLYGFRYSEVQMLMKMARRLKDRLKDNQ